MPYSYRIISLMYDIFISLNQPLRLFKITFLACFENIHFLVESGAVKIQSIFRGEIWIKKLTRLYQTEAGQYTITFRRDINELLKHIFRVPKKTAKLYTFQVYLVFGNLWFLPKKLVSSIYLCVYPTPTSKQQIYTYTVPTQPTPPNQPHLCILFVSSIKYQVLP